LSAEEKQIAKAAGITETEYARNRLRLEREKRAGQRQ
jgi:phage I-like protein